MDKEFIINVLKRLNSNQLLIDDVAVLLTEYCVVEHNKPVTGTNNFISIILSNPIIESACVNAALNYYKRKFSICELYSKEGKLLQIF